jgi:hypothetical protein
MESQLCHYDNRFRENDVSTNFSLSRIFNIFLRINPFIINPFMILRAVSCFLVFLLLAL